MATERKLPRAELLRARTADLTRRARHEAQPDDLPPSSTGNRHQRRAARKGLKT